MAKDERLYAPFDIGMDEHPKIIGLTDAAFRALFEGVLYSRRRMSDGFLDARIVLRKWGQAVADELSTNDPDRPSWIPVDNGWQIRDFEKHHPLRAEIEQKRASISALNSEKGKRSGEARRTKAEQIRTETEPDRTEHEPELNRSGTESNSETETETETISTSNEVERPPRKRGVRLSPDWMPSEQSRAKAKQDAPNVDHRAEHAVFIDYWIAQPGQKGVKTDWEATWRNWMRRKEGDIASGRGQSKKTRTEENVSFVTSLYEQQQMEIES